MPPAFIVILAAVIVAGLLFAAWDTATRPGRRRKIAAGRAAQRAAEDRPVPGLDDVARGEGWRGPLIDPLLTPGLPYGGRVPAEHPLANHPLVGQFTAQARPASLAGFAGNLTMHLHSVLNADKTLRSSTTFQSDGAGPDYCPGGPPRLVHCYRAQVGGSEFVVGNCYLTLEGDSDSYRGVAFDLGYIGSAFCAASLPQAILGHVQVVPRERAVIRGGNESGFPELDEGYRTFAPFGPGTRSRIARAARAMLPDQADPLGPQLATFIASRGDWAFTIHSGLLVCATLERLRSGEQARQLVADTARATALIGR
jgi:hypothetical protein